jgi:hypothetical protein
MNRKGSGRGARVGSVRFVRGERRTEHGLHFGGRSRHHKMVVHISEGGPAGPFATVNPVRRIAQHKASG